MKKDNIAISALVLIILVTSIVNFKLYSEVNNSSNQLVAIIKSRGTDTRKASFPAISLDKSYRSEEAINVLGLKFNEVAAWYGKNPEELKRVFRNDNSAWIDKKGRLYYVDEGLPTETISITNSSQNVGNLLPLDQTFLLHSKPDSKRTIYLNFVGQVIPGSSAWGTYYNGGLDIIAPPWDIDADPSSFSDAERERIQYMWQRVAEDYSIYDVDVTTEYAPDRITRTSLSDEYYGITALVSPISRYFGLKGGLAYVSTFNAVGDFLKPVLIFPERLSHYEKNISEAISHEVGHSLGLYHDGTLSGCGTIGCAYYNGHGTGATSWGPIMGGAFNREVSQWSIGEYPNADNFEDDLNVMLNYGLSMKVDDFGNSISTATLLNSSNGVFSLQGIIERALDTDVFKFTAIPGNISIVADGSRGSNLDILLQLKDSNGNLVSSSNNPNDLKAGIETTVSGGTYYLFIEGVGFADLATGYSDYGSLGQYQVNINNQTPTVTNQQPIAIASANITEGFGPLVIQFSGSGSSDPDGTITRYNWNFGDNTTSTEPNPIKTFTNPGTYGSTLSVTDDDGLSNSSAVNIIVRSSQTSASIIATPLSGNTPLTVLFDGTGSNINGSAIRNYIWDFGDGTSASLTSIIQHTYNTAGTYTARLTVSDINGNTASTTVLITVNNGLPVVTAGASTPLTGISPLTVDFWGIGRDSNGPIVSYRWEFGDGSTSNQAYVSHTYTQAGNYSARFTVTDQDGATASKTVLVNVQ